MFDRGLTYVMAEDERKGGGGKGEEEDAGTAPDTPVITVFGLTVEPNMCPVQDALKLEVEFKSDREITGAKWEVTVRHGRVHECWWRKRAGGRQDARGARVVVVGAEAGVREATP